MISVCLASYNGEMYIQEQIYSILGQLGPNDELIISDDNSDDNTYNIVLGFNDSRIKWVNSTAGNPSHNFANAISLAQGDYLFLSDQDDIWMPNKVEVMCVYLREYDLVMHDAFLVDSKCNIVSSSGIHSKPQKGLLQNFIKNTMFTGCCMAFRREILLDLYPFPNKKVLHDWWIGMIAIMLGYKYLYIDDKLIKYRRHDANFSSFIKSKNTFFQKVLLRWYLIIGLLVNRILKIKKQLLHKLS